MKAGNDEEEKENLVDMSNSKTAADSKDKGKYMQLQGDSSER